MPRNKNKKSGRKTGKPKSKDVMKNELSATTFVYWGPVVPPSAMKGISLNTLVLTEEGPFTTTSGGIISFVFPFANPSGATDWTTASGLYDEYRTLALSVQYYPNTEDCLTTNSALLIFNPIYTVIDRDSNAALTSYAQAANYEALKVFSLTKRFRIDMKMSGLNVQTNNNTSNTASEGAFLNCAAVPTYCGSIKMFSGTNSTSTTYGRFVVRYLVQFRGRGL